MGIKSIKISNHSDKMRYNCSSALDDYFHVSNSDEQAFQAMVNSIDPNNTNTFDVSEPIVLDDFYTAELLNLHVQNAIVAKPSGIDGFGSIAAERSQVDVYLNSTDANDKAARVKSSSIDGLSNNMALKLMGKELKRGNVEGYKGMREAFLERVDGKIGQKIKHYDKLLSKMEPESVNAGTQDSMNNMTNDNEINAATEDNENTGNAVDLGANSIDLDSSNDKALIVGIEYDNTGNPCPGAEKDAYTWSNMLSEYDQELLIDHQATKFEIISSIEEAAETLEAGETFVFTYSGHGSQHIDTNGDETDGLDEQIHVWDGSLLDDDIWNALDQFKEGVNVITVMDTCSSDTNTDINKADSGNANFVAISGSTSDDYSYGDSSGGVLTNAFADALTDSSYANYYDLFDAVNKDVMSFGLGQQPTFETGGPSGDQLANQSPFGLA